LNVRHLHARLSAALDQQHREPSGPLGQLIGVCMRRQHIPETDWSIDLLQLRPTDRVLELGFGAGRGLALALARVPQGRVIGLDRSPTMLWVAARSNRTALRQGRLRLLRGDLAQLPFAGPTVDAIVTIHTFYFWPNPLDVARQLVALLAPGGRLVSTFATTRTRPDGTREVWPVQVQAEALAVALAEQRDLQVALRSGPNSRQFNNLALVVERAPVR
jgi:SAM-dependent methyltransferase